jgi:methanogenic corrinoid protein MtbC1
LGKASLVESDDIPIDYRNDSKILSALSKYHPRDIKKRNNASKKIKQKLYTKITEGDIQESLKIYEEYIKTFNTVDFFDKILKPVMSKVGSDWESGKISVGTEHVASNIAHTLVKSIMEPVNRPVNKKKILICVPIGEEHHLGCDVLETYLSMNGFEVFNMCTSVPTESILNFIDDNNPDIVLISITISDNIDPGRRLVRKINKESDIPVLVGGLAVQENTSLKFGGKIIGDLSLSDIKKKIGCEING